MNNQVSPAYGEKYVPTLISYCIFDMDGLLLDTERIYTEVTQSIVSEWGKTYTWAIKGRMLGTREKESAEILVKALNLPITPEEYLVRRNRMQNELFHTCRPLPGVVKLIKHLKSCGIPIAVATSSHQGAYKVKTSENQELFKLFDVIVTGDDPSVHNGKPAPDIFLSPTWTTTISNAVALTWTARATMVKAVYC
jgi:beta-phosphoglucomutase-like phosphatase (HAD superfamily)